MTVYLYVQITKRSEYEKYSNKFSENSWHGTKNKQDLIEQYESSISFYWKDIVGFQVWNTFINMLNLHRLI